MEKPVIVDGKLLQPGFAPHTRNDSLAKVKIIPNKEIKKEKEKKKEKNIEPLNYFQKTRKSEGREVSLK